MIIYIDFFDFLRSKVGPLARNEWFLLFFFLFFFIHHFFLFFIFLLVSTHCEIESEVFHDEIGQIIAFHCDWSPHFGLCILCCTFNMLVNYFGFFELNLGIQVFDRGAGFILNLFEFLSNKCPEICCEDLTRVESLCHHVLDLLFNNPVELF